LLWPCARPYPLRLPTTLPVRRSLSFKVEVSEVRSGKLLRGGQVDIRGNTDDMWLRGVRFLVKNRLTDPPLTAAAQ
jgi:hypothetical protein